MVRHEQSRNDQAGETPSARLPGLTSTREARKTSRSFSEARNGRFRPISVDPLLAIRSDRLVADDVQEPAAAKRVLTFLVVDDNDEHRFLLTKTLLRKFPNASVQECQDDETALVLAQAENLSAIVTHRTVGMGGIELIRGFRRVNPRVPVVMVSGIDRTKEALEAGATRFLLYDEWLRVGTLVAELLANERPSPSAQESGPVLV
jgi:CheY-like chemotaxis protein